MTVRTSIPWLDDMGSVLDAAAAEVAQKAETLMEPYVPKETGALRGSARVADGEEGAAVEYLEEYAGYLYDAPENLNWSTSGTGPKWDQKMIDERGEELADYTADVILGAMR